MYHHHDVARYFSHMVAEPPFRSTLNVVDMAEYIQRVGEHPAELLVEERNLLSLVYKNAVDSRCATWRVTTSVEQRVRNSWFYTRGSTSRKWKMNSRSVMASLH